ncbi:hypothetical protein Agub_g5254, partial [Astrephomene gubernaculifera]
MATDAEQLKTDQADDGSASRQQSNDGETLTIMSWNINCLAPTVRDMELRHKSFRGFLDHFGVDIACFQEVKLPAAKMTRELTCVEGFQSFWATSKGKTGYSGVTTWCRTPIAAPYDAAADCLGGEEQPELDNEGRLVLTDHGSFVLLNVYVPNAGDRPDRPRLPYKLAFLRALRNKMDELTAEGRMVIAVGDFNVAAEARDVHAVLNFDGMYDSRELALLRGLIAAYPDVWRRLHPYTQGTYTVWEERTSARAFNAGLRIDYVLVSPALLPYIAACDILPASAIPPKWSDHAALLLRLRVRQGGLQQQQQQHLGLPGQQGSQQPDAAPGVAEAQGGLQQQQQAEEDEGKGESRLSPRLELPPPPPAPCAMWVATESRFIDRNQKSIRDLLFGPRRPSKTDNGGSGSGSGSRKRAASEAADAVAAVDDAGDRDEDDEGRQAKRRSSVTVSAATVTQAAAAVRQPEVAVAAEGDTRESRALGSLGVEGMHGGGVR